MAIQLTARTQNPLRSRSRVRIVVVFIFAVIPLSFLANHVLGFQLSGWTWLLILAAAAPVVLTEPLHQRAVRLLLPYLLFLVYAAVSLAWTDSFDDGVASLAQFTVPVLAYLVAWRIPDSTAVQQRLSLMALRGLGVAILVTVLFLTGLNLRFSVVLSPRPMSISLAVLFVVATLDSPSWRRTTVLGLVALITAGAVGSRLSSAVLLVMLLTSPSLGVRRGTRLVMAVACVLLVVAASNTPAFKNRFFFNEDATLEDAITLSSQLNTTGRRELWPELIKRCSPAAMTGLGISSSNALSVKLSGLDHPHNEYIRVYCDEGWVGSMLIWSFLAWAAIRSWRGASAGQDTRLHAAAGQLTAALLLFAITDNPLTYTAHFMAPMAVILGLSDRALLEPISTRRAEMPDPPASARPGRSSDSGTRP
jgi:O-antigen ligase